MFEQLTQLVNQFGEQAVVKNNAIPNELNEQVKQETGNSILEGLKGMVSGGNLDMITGLLSGNNGAQASGGNPIVEMLTKQVVSNLGSKLGIDNQAAMGVASSMIPNILSSLVGNAKDPNVKGFDVSDLIGMISGNNGDAKSSILDKLSSMGLDQNGDGKLDMSDAMAALSGKGGIGGMLGGLFGGKK
ncbi:MAG: DUF937 domain-containing protein [Flavobacterium sp.]|jgi:hypothetical protein